MQTLSKPIKMDIVLKGFMKMSRSFAFSLLFICHIAYGQLPSNPIGSNPHGLQWSQINTDKVQVIFPVGLDSFGLRVANIVHDLWDKDQKSIGGQNIKVPILIHGLNVRSNAFVTVGPFRSEFYTVPPQFKNTIDWVDELAIHEYRHVQQFANATQGITKMAKSIFGSWAWGGFMATALPRWYFEGDAVIAETGLSQAGRGRLPEFNMDYHALFHAGVTYGYEKAAAGSLKDFVPNWYPLGYNMLSYGREQYGTDIWKDVASDAVRYKGILYPFGKSLVKRTGLTPGQLYQASMNDLNTKWNQIDKGKQDEAQLVSVKSKKTVTSYSHPIQLKNGSLLTVKTGYDRLFELVIMGSDGKEQLLTQTGVLLEGNLTSISTCQSKVVWSELAYDPRWPNRNYSELVQYDLIHNKKERLTRHTRYYSPDYSDNGYKIATISVNDQLVQSLVIISAGSGEVLKEMPGRFSVGLSYPQWIDDNHVAYVLTQNQKNCIVKINLDSHVIDTLTEFSYNQISHLYAFGESIYYSMADHEVNNIFSVDLNSRQVKKHTDAIVGAFQPSLSTDGATLYYSELDIMGYNVKKIPLREYKAFEKSQIPAQYHESIAIEEGGNILDSISYTKFKIQKFNKGSGLINFHSLVPEWTDPNVSLRLLSDNTFGTLSGEITGNYNYNEDEFSYGAGFRYAELYPILNLSYTKSGRNALFYNFSGLSDTTLIQRLFIEEWDENRLTAGFTLPYIFSKGTMRNNLALRANYNYVDINIKNLDMPMEDLLRDTLVFSPTNRNALSAIYSEPISDQSIHALDLRLTLSMFQLQARQHLKPRLGLFLDARYRANVGSNDLGGNSMGLRGDIYLPGLSRNHNFYMSALYQKENILDNYRFSDQFVYPRGYEFSLRRDEYYKVGFNYSFPIFYPDRALYGLAFLKRVKGNMFFDYGRYGITQFPFNRNFSNVSSAGFELGFDIRALRLLEIDFGMRYSYLLNENFAPGGQRHQFDFFVISISE